MKSGHGSQRLGPVKCMGRGSEKTGGRRAPVCGRAGGQVGGLPGPALVYLPRNQVLEAVQLVLVLRVVPGVLFSEEGLGRTDGYLGFPVPSVWTPNPAVWCWERAPLGRGSSELTNTWWGRDPQ